MAGASHARAPAPDSSPFAKAAYPAENVTRRDVFLYYRFHAPGKGTVNSTFEVIDSVSGEVKYRATGASDLAVGAFGGSMESVIEKNIDALLDGYQG